MSQECATLWRAGGSAANAVTVGAADATSGGAEHPSAALSQTEQPKVADFGIADGKAEYTFSEVYLELLIDPCWTSIDEVIDAVFRQFSSVQLPVITRTRGECALLVRIDRHDRKAVVIASPETICPNNRYLVMTREDFQSYHQIWSRNATQQALARRRHYSDGETTDDILAEELLNPLDEKERVDKEKEIASSKGRKRKLATPEYDYYWHWHLHNIGSAIMVLEAL